MKKNKRSKPFIPANKQEKMAFLAQLDSKEAQKYEGKRHSFKRSFESTYLRSNILKKALTEIPKAEIDRIISDQEFDSVTKYMAAKVNARYRDFLLVYGFDVEDLVSISRLFGLNFYTSKYDAKTKKDEYYLMLRYIGQRFHRFIDWSTKKFGTSMPVKPKKAKSGSEEAIDIVALYDEFAFKDWSSHSHSEVDEVNGIMVNMKKQRPVSELKAELDGNWEKHKESLAHYATTVYTSHDVRKKARSYCTKYGIDYVQWAKAKIELGKMSDQDVDLR